MSWYWFMLGVLAVWRVTHLLQAEDGPGDVIARLRSRLGRGFLGRLLDCFYCLSVWVAFPMAAAIGQTWWERALLWPALSGGAALLQRATERTPPPAAFVEDKEKDE